MDRRPSYADWYASMCSKLSSYLPVNEACTASDFLDSWSGILNDTVSTAPKLVPSHIVGRASDGSATGKET